jgi:hypothetical protein
MAATTRYNGDYGNFTQGTLYSVAQLKAFLITVKDASAVAVNLSAQDCDAAGEVDQAVAAIIKEVQPLMYELASGGSSNVIHVIVDGHAVDAASLQGRLQALGTVNSADISGTTVALGAHIVVS